MYIPRQLTVILIILLLSVRSISQTALSKEDYLKKSKSQKTAAWIMLGTGAASLAIAAPGEVSFDVLPALVIGGGGLVAGSIPLFIASGKNKRKAMNMSFRFQQIQLPQGSGFAEKKIPSLNLKLNL